MIGKKSTLNEQIFRKQFFNQSISVKLIDMPG